MNKLTSNLIKINKINIDTGTQSFKEYFYFVFRVRTYYMHTLKILFLIIFFPSFYGLNNIIIIVIYTLYNI